MFICFYVFAFISLFISSSFIYFISDFKANNYFFIVG